MAVPIVVPIVGYSVLCVLVSYLAIRLYRSRGSCSNVLPNPVSALGRTTAWDWPKSFTWSRPSGKKKAKPSKHISVDLLPITGLPPPPTALPITPPPLVDISSTSISSTPSPPVSFYQPINKQIHTLHPTSFSRPPSPHTLLVTTSPQKLPRRSRSLGGVPVRRLSGGASGLRNVQILDMEMQEMDRGTSREHLLIDFSSSDSSDELGAFRKENDEEGMISRKISPAASDIGVLPSHGRPSLFDDAQVPLVDLAPGRKVLPLVDLGDSEDGLGIKQKEEDTWKWFAPLPGKIQFMPLESTSMAKPISKSISEPLPITLLPLPISEGKLIDLHSGHEQEHVLVDLDVQDDNNVPQQEQPQLTHVHRTRVDFDAVATTITKAALPLDESPIVLEGRRSLDSLMKPILDITTTPDHIPVEIQNPIPSSVQESSQRGRRVDRHPLEQVDEEMKATPEKAEVSPVVTIRTALVENEVHQELANEHENHELYDHDDDTYDKHHDHHDHHRPKSHEERELQSLSSSQVATIPVQAAPAWYWDHEDDPWNGAVGIVEEEDGTESRERALFGEREVAEGGGKVGEDDEKGKDLMDVSEMEVGLEVGEDENAIKTSPGFKVVELPVDLPLEEVSTETEDEESYPDPDYLPLPELLLDQSSPVAYTDIPLVLVEDGSSNSAQEDEGVDSDQNTEDLQQFKDDEKSPRRAAAQMPTPPASPPPISTLRIKSLCGTVDVRSGPPSPNSLSPMGGLLPLAALLPTPQSTSPKSAPLLTLPNTSSSSPAVEVQMKVSEGGKENPAAGVDKENETPSSATGRPLWSIRADDAPALGLAASSLSTSTSSTGLIPDPGTSMDVTQRMKREEVKEDTLQEEKEEDDEEESSLPGAFPEPLKATTSSDTNAIIAPTITIAALTSTLLSTSIAAASSSTTSSTVLETPTMKRRPIARSPLDIALAMQLRPGLGVGADPAWMVRFLMAMFGWFAILVSGQGEF